MARYADLNLAGSEYIPQYAGAPLAEIQQTADKLASRHYSNIANASQTKILGMQMRESLLPGAREYADQHIAAIDQALDEMAKSGGENSTSRINAIATSLQSDPGLLQGLEKAKAYNEFKKTRDQLTANGFDPVWNKDLEQKYLNAPITDPETGNRTELYNQPFSLVAEKRLNYMDQQDKVVEPLRANAWETDLKKAWSVAQSAGVRDDEFLQSNTYRSLSSKKVQDYLFKPVPGPEGKTINGLGWTSYKDSPEYRQQKMLGMSDTDIKAELQSRGEAKVFEEVSKQFVRNPNAESQASNTPSATTVTVPAPAAVRDIDQLKRASNTEWVDPADITKTGVRKSFIGNSLDYLANEAESVLMSVQGRKEGETKEQYAERKKANDARANEILSGNNRDSAKTKQAINDFKVVMDVAGFQATVANPGISVGTSKRDPGSMTDKEVLALAATPEGRAMMKSYQDTYQKLRYSMPFIQIPVEEGARQANEDFIRGSFDLRQIVDPVSGKHYGNIRDEDGEINDDLADLHRALVNKTAIYTGEFTPQNLLTEIDNSGENFVRGRKIIAPSQDGLSSKEYYIGELPTLTQPSDVNENVLFRRATETPGAKTTVGKGVDVQVLASPQQKEAVYNKQGAKWALDYPTFTKDKFMSGQAVLVSVEGQTIPFANYTAAAQYLASKGIKLDIK